MALDVLAIEDELGNNATHFFKSGNILRNPKCTSLEMAKLLPAQGLYKTNLEYDLWYDVGGKDAIHGYVYTDMLSDYLYIKPANVFFSENAMYKSTELEPSEYGRELIEELGRGVLDKYRLRKAESDHKFVVFLPGTNCIQELLDFDKTKRAVDQGAVVKPHPLSSVSLLVYLKNAFGEDNVLGKKESGHELMRGADIVGCCANSEMGIAAIAARKGFHLFSDIKSRKHSTYTSIYKAVLSGGDYRENLTKLFSSPFSGIVHGKSDDAVDRIAAFFNQFTGVPHIAAKNTNS